MARVQLIVRRRWPIVVFALLASVSLLAQHVRIDGITQFANSIVVNSGGITVPTTSCYGFTGVSNCFGLSGISTAVKAADGGAYLLVSNGSVFVNSAVLNMGSGGSADTDFTRAASGNVSIGNNGSIGSRFKVDALPTVGSGFGTSPAVVAGSTPFAGAVNVGTGGVATSGVVTFGGTAFPAAPFCVAGTGNANNFPVNVTPTTTQITFNSGAAFPASILVYWICPSSK